VTNPVPERRHLPELLNRAQFCLQVRRIDTESETLQHLNHVVSLRIEHDRAV
jgi:hypothetical protein